MPWRWMYVEETAFTIIKEKLTSLPILGAVLFQNQGGKKRVIAYANRRLRHSETNYPAHKLDFLALKWAVYDKPHDFLNGNQFEVITNNNNLTYIFTKAKHDATSQRLVATYDFKLSYRSGHLNGDADGLSCKPVVLNDTVKVI